MIWLLLLINLLILVIEVPSLIRSRLYSELGVFTIFFVIGLYFSLGFYYHWPLQGPFDTLLTYAGQY